MDSAMYMADKFKCDGGPAFSHAAAHHDELEWNGRKQRPDRNARSNRAGDEDLHPLCAQLKPGREMCGSASESRCHLGSSGVSPLVLVDFRSTWDLKLHRLHGWRWSSPIAS